jgi:hypothetical protein
LPALHFSRKRVRVRRDDVVAFVDQHVAAGLGAVYSPAHERDRSPTAKTPAPADTGSAGRPDRRNIEHGRALGTGRDPHQRTGRPLDSTRGR